MLSRGRALGDGPDQTASCDVRPGGRPGITFRREPACVPFSQRRAAQPAGDSAATFPRNNETMDLIRLASSAPSYA